MNERIEELAGQCIDPKWTVTGPMFDREKFAELIVKECARVAFESDLTMAIGQWGADSAILKHFGVEE
jgi:hypothetical protein